MREKHKTKHCLNGMVTAGPLYTNWKLIIKKKTVGHIILLFYHGVNPFRSSAATIMVKWIFISLLHWEKHLAFFQKLAVQRHIALPSPVRIHLRTWSWPLLPPCPHRLMCTTWCSHVWRSEITSDIEHFMFLYPFYFVQVSTLPGKSILISFFQLFYFLTRKIS